MKERTVQRCFMRNNYYLSLSFFLSLAYKTEIYCSSNSCLHHPMRFHHCLNSAKPWNHSDSSLGWGCSSPNHWSVCADHHSVFDNSCTSTTLRFYRECLWELISQALFDNTHLTITHRHSGFQCVCFFSISSNFRRIYC